MRQARMCPDVEVSRSGGPQRQRVTLRRRQTQVGPRAEMSALAADQFALESVTRSQSFWWNQSNCIWCCAEWVHGRTECTTGGGGKARKAIRRRCRQQSDGRTLFTGRLWALCWYQQAAVAGIALGCLAGAQTYSAVRSKQRQEAAERRVRRNEARANRAAASVAMHPVHQSIVQLHRANVMHRP